MTQMTLLGGVDVGGTLAAGGYTIVATDAVIDKRRVINNRWNPRADGMTGIALFRGRYMARALPRCYYVIVTTAANANNFSVVNICIGHGYPRCGSRLMAGIASIGGVNVVSAFATGHYAIMTTGTTTNDLRMVNCC